MPSRTTNHRLPLMDLPAVAERLGVNHRHVAAWWRSDAFPTSSGATCSGSTRPRSTHGLTSTVGLQRREASRRLLSDVSTQPTDAGHTRGDLELPVDEVLRTARPYPPREELLIDDLTDEEEEAFWEAISR